LETEVEAAIKAGWFPAEEKEALLHQLQKIVNHPDLHPYFSIDAEVLNERDILLPEGKTKRPDRIVFKDGKAHIMDYKTGEKLPKHQSQVMEYANLLEEMGLETGEKLLIYLSDIVEVVSCKRKDEGDQLNLWA